MTDLNRFLIGVCAPTVPTLSQVLPIYDNTKCIKPLPKFSYILRYNTFTCTYYHMNGKVVTNIYEIIKHHIPIIRYKDRTEDSFEIVKFVSTDEFPEGSICVHQYALPEEVSTDEAEGVGYFQINILFTYSNLLKLLKNGEYDWLEKKPGFETIEEQFAEIYSQLYMLTRYRYTDQSDTLILGSHFEKVDCKFLFDTILGYLYKVDSSEKVVGVSRNGGPRSKLLYCIANKDYEELRRNLDNECRKLQSCGNSGL